MDLLDKGCKLLACAGWEVYIILYMLHKVYRSAPNWGDVVVPLYWITDFVHFTFARWRHDILHPVQSILLPALLREEDLDPVQAGRKHAGYMKPHLRR